jgi:hypothetical protein
MGMSNAACVKEDVKSGKAQKDSVKRINIDGKLCMLVYEDIKAIESRPIEIKPFFH